ncbi:MAG: PEP-CTERM sorting domain-containing protein [Phycisphaerales bacterium]|nr:PEP-CTERM sorting domain-containing protein [Phycisphaerales bacterium]
MHVRRFCTRVLVCALVSGVASAAHADIVVFQNTPNNGWFVPFNSGNADTVLYGDSGWLGNTGGTFTLTRIEFGFASQNGLLDGTTDIKFTLNDGSPSGLVFGSGAELYSDTITDVDLTAGASPTYFTVGFDLPNIETLGGFNNVGWSIGLENYSFDGDFGFQSSTASGQSVGFYTNNASFYNGSSWSLFAFSGDSETGVANFVTTIYAVPEPATGGLLAIGLMLVARHKSRRAA